MDSEEEAEMILNTTKVRFPNLSREIIPPDVGTVAAPKVMRRTRLVLKPKLPVPPAPEFSAEELAEKLEQYQRAGITAPRPYVSKIAFDTPSTSGPALSSYSAQASSSALISDLPLYPELSSGPTEMPDVSSAISREAANETTTPGTKRGKKRTITVEISDSDSDIIEMISPKDKKALEKLREISRREWEMREQVIEDMRKQLERADKAKARRLAEMRARGESEEDEVEVPRPVPKKSKYKKTFTPRAIPDPNRGYVCSMCDREFRTRGLLREHEHTHPGITQAECPLCGTKIKYQYNLRSHITKCRESLRERMGSQNGSIYFPEYAKRLKEAIRDPSIALPLLPDGFVMNPDGIVTGSDPNLDTFAIMKKIKAEENKMRAKARSGIIDDDDDDDIRRGSRSSRGRGGGRGGVAARRRQARGRPPTQPSTFYIDSDESDEDIF